MIRFQCPVCNTKMSAADSEAGRKGGCPNCGQRVQIPSGVLPQRHTVLGKALPLSEEEPARTRRRRLKVSAIIAVTTGLIGIVTALFLAVARYYEIQEAARRAEKARIEVEQLSRPASGAPTDAEKSQSGAEHQKTAEILRTLPPTRPAREGVPSASQENRPDRTDSPVEPPSPPNSRSETPQKEPLKPPAKAEEPAREDGVPTDAELRRFAADGKPVREILSPDGRWTLSWSDVKTLLLWDARTGKELWRFRGHTVQGSGPAFSTDGSQVAAFSPDGKQVLSGGWDKTVRLWDAATGEQLRVFEGHTSHVHAVAFSPDGKRAASAAGGFVQRDGRRVFVDCTVRLWDVESGRQLKTFEGHKEWVVCIAFSPDGRRLLSGSYDKTIRLWDVESGRQLRQFLGHTGAVGRVGFSPGGRYVLTVGAAGGLDRTARVWDAVSGRELKRIDLAGAEGRVPAAPAGKGCRSVHLSYAGDEGTAFYNEVTMDKSTPGTYFMVCGWDRGYYGIQEQDKGVKILLFSVWDDSKQNEPDAVPADKRVKLVYRDRAVRVGRFGGEGTGGQSFFPYNWKVGQTYRFLVAAREKDGWTEYAGYFYEPERKDWRHLVTFSAPKGNGKLRGYYSFIEDFLQDGKSRVLPRQAHFGNGWVKAKGEWARLAQARFTATNDPARNIGAGADPLFWLSTGGVVPEVSAALNNDIRLPDEAKHSWPDDLPVK